MYRDDPIPEHGITVTRSRRRWVLLGIVMVVAGVLWWGWPSGPTITSYGQVGEVGAPQELEGPGLRLSLDACNPSYQRIDVDETPEAVTVRVHATGWMSPFGPLCAVFGLPVPLDEPLGDREVYDAGGWFRIPRPVTGNSG